MTYKYFHISKKSDYAVRALFELALRNDSGPVNVRSIAEAQSIPLRFLEIILNELKQGNFVISARGKAGGYQLAREAWDITLAQIIQFFEKSSDKTNGIENGVNSGDAVTVGIISQVNSYIDSVCNDMTLQKMVDEYKNKLAYDYVI